MSDVGTALSVTPMVTLLSAVVGGLIGILAGFVGPYFTQRAKDAADKRRKRAEKFEELVGAVYEYDHWMDTTRRVRVAGYEGEITVSPFAKTHAISDTYFPQFTRAIEELRTAGDAYGTWMLAAQAKRALDGAGLYPGHETVTEPYVEKLEALLTEPRSFARREFQ